MSLEEQSLTYERSPYESSCTGKPKFEKRLLRRRLRTKTDAAPADWSTLRTDGRHSCPLNVISTVILRLTKIIRSGIKLVSRNIR